MEDPNLSIAKKAVVNIGYAPTFVGKVSTMNGEYDELYGRV